jgi:hypothetical protein
LLIIRKYRRFRSKKEKNELQQETVRDGKLRANPLHLSEEELTVRDGKLRANPLHLPEEETK